MAVRPTPDELIDGVKRRDRRSLARAITLVESTRPDDQRAAGVVLDQLASIVGDTIRIGISGTPGVGKSTFIEALGLQLVDRNHRLAVLAIDPSSNSGRGAILGDKTRMGSLSRHPDVFIRPSPSGRTLGGVTSSTADARTLVEAAGYDVVLIETVGVGQSEVAVASLCDIFLLLVAPGGGDELQGIKRGVLEVADLVVVNKADGSRIEEAQITSAEYRNAMGFVRRANGQDHAPVISCSSLDPASVSDVWAEVDRLWSARRAAGDIGERRRHQRQASVRRRVSARLEAMINTAQARSIYREVEDGTRSELSAVEFIIDLVHAGTFEAEGDEGSG